jgi:hypothetical protein
MQMNVYLTNCKKRKSRIYEIAHTNKLRLPINLTNMAPCAYEYFNELTLTNSTYEKYSAYEHSTYKHISKNTVYVRSCQSTYARHTSVVFSTYYYSAYLCLGTFFKSVCCLITLYLYFSLVYMPVVEFLITTQYSGGITELCFCFVL